MNILFILILTCIVFSVLCRKNNTLSFKTEKTLPLRGFLALCIIVHHTSQIFLKTHNETFNVIREFWDWGTPVVSVFFFMSGYGLMMSYQKKKDEYLKGFLKKRILKITPPILLSSMIFVLLSVFFPITEGNIDTSITGWNKDYPFLPTAWYVIVILLYYLAFYMIAVIFRNCKWIHIGMLIFTVLFIITARKYNFYEYWYQSVIAINVGMLVSSFEKYIFAFYSKYGKWILLFLVTLLFFVILAIRHNGSNFMFGYPVWTMLQNILISLLVYFLVADIGFPNAKLLRWLGSYSYEIYLGQGTVTLYIGKMLNCNFIPLLMVITVISIIYAYMLKNSLKILWKNRGQ